MNKSSFVRMFKSFFISMLIILPISCSSPAFNQSEDINASEVQEYVGDISRIWARGGTARYYTGQVLSNWKKQGTDVVFEGNLIEYRNVRQSILDYVAGIPSNNALMHQGYGDIAYDSSKQYVEFSSYTDIDSGDVVAYELRLFYGDFWNTYITDHWYAKSVLFNPTLTADLNTGEPLDEELTIESIRATRPWIPDTTTREPNTQYPDDYDYYLKDFVDYPFVDDPPIIGTWVAVDFVDDNTQFVPGESYWQGSPLDRTITFEADGEVSGRQTTWTAGHILSYYSQPTDSRYTIEQLEGESYLFMDHKSGDYVYRYSKPGIYVLKKQ